MAVKNIGLDQFHEEVLESKETVLLDFWAAWCGPCRMMAPILDQIAEERPDVKICKIDVDREGELAKQFQVVSIPTLVVMKDGEVVARVSGARPKSQVLEML